MDRCKPTELRKAMIMVNEFKKVGIGFIPVPYTTEDEKLDLVVMAMAKLEGIEKEAEG